MEHYLVTLVSLNLTLRTKENVGKPQDPLYLQEEKKQQRISTIASDKNAVHYPLHIEIA